MTVLQVNNILADMNEPIPEDQLGEIQSSGKEDNDSAYIGQNTARSGAAALPKSPPFMGVDPTRSETRLYDTNLTPNVEIIAEMMETDPKTYQHVSSIKDITQYHRRTRSNFGNHLSDQIGGKELNKYG